MKDKSITVFGGTPYLKPFEVWGDVTLIFDAESITNYSCLLHADLVVFTGGEDVDPTIYGEEVLPTTQCNPARDTAEIAVFEYCVSHHIPMAGICRGGQFLTVMSGGQLAQQADNHLLPLDETHEIITIDRDRLEEGYMASESAFGRVQVNSTHHQLMYPWTLNKRDFILLAYVKGLSTEFLDICRGGRFSEPEALYYPKTESLCVQFHPELMDIDSEGFKYYQELLSTWCFK